MDYCSTCRHWEREYSDLGKRYDGVCGRPTDLYANEAVLCWSKKRCGEYFGCVHYESRTLDKTCGKCEWQSFATGEFNGNNEEVYICGADISGLAFVSNGRAACQHFKELLSRPQDACLRCKYNWRRCRWVNNNDPSNRPDYCHASIINPWRGSDGHS